MKDYGCKKLYTFQTHTYLKNLSLQSPMQAHIHTLDVSMCVPHVANLTWQGALVNCAGERRGD